MIKSENDKSSIVSKHVKLLLVRVLLQFLALCVSSASLLMHLGSTMVTQMSGTLLLM